MIKIVLPFFLFSIALASHAEELFIKNGNMEAGTHNPENWTVQGKALVARDTTVRKSDTASLRMELEGSWGGAYQKLLSLPPGDFTIKGSFRAEGTFEQSQVALQYFDTTPRDIAWKVVTLIKPGSEWTDFQISTRIPSKVASALLVLTAKGSGKIWLDDLSVENGALAGQPEPTKAPVIFTPEASPLARTIAADDSHLHYSGRFDTTSPKAPRCAWPASAVTLKFKGQAANVQVSGKEGVAWQVILDGKPGAVLTNNGQSQILNLAKDLPAGEHTINLVKRTEAHVGVATIYGFQLDEESEILQAPAPTRRIEVIGDSISAGYGNEAKDQHEGFKPATENASIAYGFLTAQKLQADYICIAWSGKKLWPDKLIPEIYDRTIPQEEASQWDFSKGKPDVVVINLGTNDFSPGNPEEEGWVSAYKTFIARIRKNDPDAFIFCAISPMIADPYSKSKNARTTITAYIRRVVDETQKAGDSKVALVEFPAQTGKLGFGAGWHPSAKQHEAMAAVLEEAIKAKLNW